MFNEAKYLERFPSCRCVNVWSKLPEQWNTFFTSTTFIVFSPSVLLCGTLVATVATSNGTNSDALRKKTFMVCISFTTILFVTFLQLLHVSRGLDRLRIYLWSFCFQKGWHFFNQLDENQYPVQWFLFLRNIHAGKCKITRREFNSCHSQVYIDPLCKHWGSFENVFQRKSARHNFFLHLPVS